MTLTQEMVEAAGDIVASTGHKDIENIISPEEAGMSVPEEGILNTPVMDAEEEAAMKFTKLLPFIAKLGNALPSKGGAVRVLVALGEFPLGGRQPRLLNDAERQLFNVMQELNGYKSKIITGFMKKQTDLEQAQKQAAMASSETPEGPGESEGSNGGN